jgi:hypothetical protein
MHTAVGPGQTKSHQVKPKSDARRVRCADAGSEVLPHGQCAPSRKWLSRTAPYRLVPLGTAWDRINFFLSAETGEKSVRQIVVVAGENTIRRGPSGRAPSRLGPLKAASPNVQPFQGCDDRRTLPKVGPLGIGPTVGLNDSIPLGLAVSVKRKWLISRI